MSNRASQVTRNNNAQHAQQGSNEYFDLHTRGCGYLSRVRWVNTKTRGRKSEPFLCCAINALHGDINDPSYSYFDLRVTGIEAQQLIASFESYVAQKRKVFIAFKIGDIYAHPYERTIKDQRTGEVTGTEWSALIKGRLLQVTHAKVDGAVLYSTRQETVPESRTTTDEAMSESDQDQDGHHDISGEDDTDYDQHTGTY